MNIRIKDICRFGKKSDIKAGEGNTKGKYMFFTSSIDKDKRIDKFDYDEEGIIMGTGGNATLHYYSGKFAVSTDCLVLLPNSSYKCKYLYYFFLHNMRVLEGGFRGAGLKHTSKSYIENIELTKTHSLLEQDKIISVLSNIDNTIVLQNKRLKLINELTRSLFIEMFGDPSTNPKGWNETTIGNECFYIKDGPHKSLPDIGKENSGHPFISVRNIVNGYIDLSTARYISDEDYNDAIKKCHPEKGDMLYSKGGTTGIAKLIDIDNKFANWVHVAVLKFDKVNLNGIFFENMLNGDYCYKQSQKLTKGIANKDLVLSAISQIKIYRPPIELQNKFANFVIGTDKSKYSSFSHLSA